MSDLIKRCKVAAGHAVSTEVYDCLYACIAELERLEQEVVRLHKMLEATDTAARERFAEYRLADKATRNDDE